MPNESEERERLRYLQLKRKKGGSVHPAIDDAQQFGGGQQDQAQENFLARAAQTAAQSPVMSAIGRSIPPVVGGAAGAALGGPIGGVLGAGAGEAWYQAGRQVQRGIEGGGQQFATPGEVVTNVGAQMGAEVLGQGIMAGGARAYRALAPGARDIGAQVVRAASGIPERAAKEVISDPSILSRALSVEDAGKVYAQSTPGLKSGIRGSREVFGKSRLSLDDAFNKFDELVPEIDNGTLDVQKALTLRQDMMKKLSKLPGDQQDAKSVLSEAVEILDDYIEPKVPGWAGARRGYREAKVAEEFSSFLPRNKNLSPNVLRTTGALAAAAGGLASDNPWATAALPFISPRMWGYGIRAAATGGRIAGSRVASGVYRIPLAIAAERAARESAGLPPGAEQEQDPRRLPSQP